MNPILLTMNHVVIPYAHLVALFCPTASPVSTREARFARLGMSGFKLMTNLKTAQGLCFFKT
jgi:hypothetical protein